jgi:uncharacterized protein (TIGR03790 family)
MINRRFLAVCKFNLIVILFLSSKTFALGVDEIVVLANKNASGSIEVAKYYMKERSIPESHLITLWITDKEWCSREDFQQKVVLPVRRLLNENDVFKKVRCLVTTYGLPLKISPPEMTQDQKDLVKSLKEKRYAMGKDLEKIPKEEAEKRKSIQNELKRMSDRVMAISKKDHRSSFDSELSLVLEENYPLKGWVKNPFFLGFKGHNINISKNKVLMVSRLDGPDAKTVKRIINDSIAVEKTGLKGTAYFDARWKDPGEKNVSGYASYDRSIHLAARGVADKSKLKVIVDDKQALFQPGDCPDAALYCGWYSHHKYIDAFKWVPGAVGYHIASSECSTLKNEKSQVWCKKMIDNGVAATIGPVGEPYLQSFPVPEIFFDLLVKGTLSLVECYTLSLPYLSWQMVLVGDPLYTPFKVQ